MLSDSSRVLVPMADRRQVAVLYPELHGRLPSIPFDAVIGSVAVSPSGQRALATSGRERAGRYAVVGYRIVRRSRSTGSTVYAFDPSRSAFQADYIRLEVGAQPWRAVFTAEDHALVSLRADDALAAITWSEEGVVTGDPVETCASPSELIATPDREAVLVQCDDVVRLVDPSGMRLFTWELGEITDIAISPDGAVAYVAHEVDVEDGDDTGAITALDLESHETTRHAVEEAPTALSLYGDGRTLAALVGRRLLVLGAAREEDTEVPQADDAGARLTPTQRINVGGQPMAVVFGGEPERLVVGSFRPGEIAVLDPEDGSVVWSDRPGHYVEFLHVVHDRWITAHQGFFSHTLSVWDMNETRGEGEPPERRRVSIGQNVGDVMPLDDGESVLVSAVGSNHLKRVRLTDLTVTGSVRLPRAPGALVPVTIRGAQHAAAMGGIFRANLLTGRMRSAGAWVMLIDLSADPFGSVRRELSAGEQPRYPGVTADGRVLLFPDRESNQVTRVDVEAVGAEPQVTAIGESPEAVAVLWDDERALSIDAGSNTATVIRLAPLEAIRPIELDHSPRALAVSSQGQFAIVAETGDRFPARGSGVVMLAGDPLAVFGRAETGTGPYGVAISRDGRTVATADSGGGTVSLFEVASE